MPVNDRQSDQADLVRGAGDFDPGTRFAVCLWSGSTGRRHRGSLRRYLEWNSARICGPWMQPIPESTSQFWTPRRRLHRRERMDVHLRLVAADFRCDVEVRRWQVAVDAALQTDLGSSLFRPRRRACPPRQVTGERVGVTARTRRTGNWWAMTSPTWCTGTSTSTRPVGPVGDALADPYQNAGGERDCAAAGVFQHRRPDRGVLVRGAEMRTGRVGVDRRRGRPPASSPWTARPALSRCISATHDAWVEVRQQAGLLQDPDGHRPQVRQGAVVTVAVEPLPGAASGPPGGRRG